jgi:hypothetical protein
MIRFISLLYPKRSYAQQAARYCCQSPTEGVIKLDQRKPLIQPGLRERQLCRKVICLVCKNLQITGDSALVPDIRQVCSIFGVMSQQLLTLAIFAKWLRRSDDPRSSQRPELSSVPLAVRKVPLFDANSSNEALG